MKKLIIKFGKIFGISLSILITGLIILIFFTGPKLPTNTDMIINKVINNPLPEFVKGESGYVISDNYSWKK